MPKFKHKTKSKCELCLKQEGSPIWGHQLCPLHRSCSEGNHWDPMNCSECKIQKVKAREMTDDDAREKFFYRMYVMLRDTAKYKSETSQSDWSYEQGIKKLFLCSDEPMPVPPISSFIFSPPMEENDSADHSDGGASTLSTICYIYRG